MVEQTLGDAEDVSSEVLRAGLFPAERASRDAVGDPYPSRSMLLSGLDKQEIGAQAEGPALGDSAPDFELTTVTGQTIRLSDRIGKRPVVLVFGNYTCGPFRGQAGNLKDLHEKYSLEADFLMIYVREAHPTDGWHGNGNRRSGVSIKQPASNDERSSVAQTCLEHLDFDIPLMVDTLDDSVGRTYSGGPARLYLIDTEGKIAYKGGRGPHYFFPSQLESALVWLLSDSK